MPRGYRHWRGRGRFYGKKRNPFTRDDIKRGEMIPVKEYHDLRDLFTSRCIRQIPYKENTSTDDDMLGGIKIMMIRELVQIIDRMIDKDDIDRLMSMSIDDIQEAIDLIRKPDVDVVCYEDKPVKPYVGSNCYGSDKVCYDVITPQQEIYDNLVVCYGCMNEIDTDVGVYDCFHVFCTSCILLNNTCMVCKSPRDKPHDVIDLPHKKNRYISTNVKPLCDILRDIISYRDNWLDKFNGWSQLVKSVATLVPEALDRSYQNRIMRAYALGSVFVSINKKQKKGEPVAEKDSSLLISMGQKNICSIPTFLLICAVISGAYPQLSTGIKLPHMTKGMKKILVSWLDNVSYSRNTKSELNKHKKIMKILIKSFIKDIVRKNPNKYAHAASYVEFYL